MAILGGVGGACDIKVWKSEYYPIGGAFEGCYSDELKHQGNQAYIPVAEPAINTHARRSRNRELLESAEN